MSGLDVVIGALVVHNAFRDLLELLFVVAIAGMLYSAIRSVARGEVRPLRCPNCRRPTSRAYPRCRFCNYLLESSDQQLE
ncbi:MAG: hypothetical protein ACP5PJ_01675 [Acidimicrobiales bacterium]